MGVCVRNALPEGIRRALWGVDQSGDQMGPVCTRSCLLTHWHSLCSAALSQSSP
jgi:hypothetical protein